MKKKKETGSSVSESLKYTSTISHDFGSYNTFEQKNYNFVPRGSSLVGSRDLYLTYTDKSPSNRGQKCHDFKEYSLNLYTKTMDLNKHDKKMLQQLHRLGFQKIKFINEDHIVLYSPSNPAGNSNAGWKLAQDISNSDKARLASKQSAYEKALANVEQWEYFGTFTLDKSKQDRYDFKKALVHLTKFLQYRHILYFWLVSDIKTALGIFMLCYLLRWVNILLTLRGRLLITGI